MNAIYFPHSRQSSPFPGKFDKSNDNALQSINRPSFLVCTAKLCRPVTLLIKLPLSEAMEVDGTLNPEPTTNFWHVPPGTIWEIEFRLR